MPSTVEDSRGIRVNHTAPELPELRAGVKGIHEAVTQMQEMNVRMLPGERAGNSGIRWRGGQGGGEVLF